MYERLPLTSLRAFEAVARRGSPVPAAAELYVTPGAVSRRIRELEESLGRRLFDRTPAGWVLLPSAEAFAADVSEALAAMQRALGRAGEAAETSLTIGAPRALAAFVLAPALPALLERIGPVRLTLDGERQSSVPGPGLDGVIRYGLPEPGAWPDTVLLPQGDIFPVCAPALVEDGDLDHLWRAAPRLEFLPVDYWGYWARATGRPIPTAPSRVAFSETHMIYEAAMAGAGLAIGHSRVAARLIAAGRLVQIGPAAPDERRYCLLKRTDGGGALDAFAEWIADL